MIMSWENSWEEFAPFLEFPPELRKIVYTTNSIESPNARFRRAVRHRGHFPPEQAATKVLYLTAIQQRKNTHQIGQTRRGCPGSVSRDADAFGGQGAGVHVAGDAGCADYVAFLVPGSGTNLGNFAAVRRAAERFHEGGEREVGRRRVAVVAWLNYRTPSLAEAINGGAAQAGWRALLGDITGLSSRRQTVSVVAHSYGSVLAGALWQNTIPDVDNLVTVGSPGFGSGIDSTSQLGGQRVWAGMAAKDWIQHFDCCGPTAFIPHITNLHGQDPHSPRFGGVCRFRTDDNRGHDTANEAGSGYWDPGTESFRNILNIALGRYDQVTPYSPYDRDC